MTSLNHPTRGRRLRFRMSLLFMAALLMTRFFVQSPRPLPTPQQAGMVRTPTTPTSTSGSRTPANGATTVSKESDWETYVIIGAVVAVVWWLFSDDGDQQSSNGYSGRPSTTETKLVDDGYRVWERNEEQRHLQEDERRQQQGRIDNP